MGVKTFNATMPEFYLVLMILFFLYMGLKEVNNKN